MYVFLGVTYFCNSAHNAEHSTSTLYSGLKVGPSDLSIFADS